MSIEVNWDAPELKPEKKKPAKRAEIQGEDQTAIQDKMHELEAKHGIDRAFNPETQLFVEAARAKDAKEQFEGLRQAAASSIESRLADMTLIDMDPDTYRSPIQEQFRAQLQAEVAKLDKSIQQADRAAETYQSIVEDLKNGETSGAEAYFELQIKKAESELARLEAQTENLEKATRDAMQKGDMETVAKLSTSFNQLAGKKKHADSGLRRSKDQMQYVKLMAKLPKRPAAKDKMG